MYIIFMFQGMLSLPRLSVNVFPARPNDSMIIRNSTGPEGKNVSSVPQQNGNAVTFRTVLKAVGKAL